MKYKTALRQSVVSVKFLAVAIAVMLPLAVKYPSGYTIVPLVVFVVFFVGDAFNIYRIRHEATRDATFLDRTLK